MLTYKLYLEAQSTMRMKIYYCGNIEEFRPNDWEYCFIKESDAKKYADANNLKVYSLDMIGVQYPTTLDENDENFNNNLTKAKNDVETTLDYDFIRVKNKSGYDTNDLILAYNIKLLS